MSATTRPSHSRRLCHRVDFDPSLGLDEPEDAVVLARIDADADAWAAEMERRNPLAPFARPRGRNGGAR